MKRIIPFLLLISSLLISCNFYDDSVVTNGKSDQHASVKIAASIDPKSCAVGEIITLRIHLESSGLSNLQEPRATGDLQAFKIIGRSQSTQLNIANGHKTRTMDLMQNLRAMESGTWVIPSFEVIADDGKVYRTEEIKIVVSENPNPDAPGKMKAPETSPYPSPENDIPAVENEVFI